MWKGFTVQGDKVKVTGQGHQVKVTKVKKMRNPNFKFSFRKIGSQSQVHKVKVTWSRSKGQKN